ncbi:MAG: hypothetical protein ACREB3_03220 [Burkholderiales bacterium]
MAANPYAGLTSAELTTRRTYLLAVLNGEAMQQFGGQGSNYSRKLPTLEEARLDLALVNAAIAALTDAPVTRTVGMHWYGNAL